ncbi:MAG TPA: hypothetical protein VFQ52_06750, partial [Rhizomicrobium sp.]|nr:hypothetical protein [Rhizomicrobium sp.]
MPRRAGWIWLADVAGAALFAWGIAAAIAGRASGSGGDAWPVAAMLLGGLCRATALVVVHRLAIADAQVAGVGLRRRLLGRLLGEPVVLAPSIGQAATFAIDHVATIEAYRARFVPVRMAAVVAPLAVAMIVAGASVVSAGILIVTLI